MKVMVKLLSPYILGAILFALGHSTNAQIIEPGDSITFAEPYAGRVDKADCPVLGVCAAGTAGIEAQVYSVIFLSILDSGKAQSTLYTPFTVSGDKPRILDARITGNASWRGEVWAPGLAGTEATITITATLYDLTSNAVSGSIQVHQKVCEGAGFPDFSVCRSEQIGDEDVSFTATVIRGHDYELRLTAQCLTRSGLIGADVLCAFAPLEEDLLGILNDGFVHWNGFTITLEDDIFELLEELKDGHDEIIRLLLTPQGQRQSHLIDCERNGNGNGNGNGVGTGCDFPSASAQTQTENFGSNPFGLSITDAAAASPDQSSAAMNAVSAIASPDQSSTATNAGSAIGLFTLAALSALAFIRRLL
jgi:hypothetical protein